LGAFGRGVYTQPWLFNMLGKWWLNPNQRIQGYAWTTHCGLNKATLTETS
jgi:hypothetical protein